jgi:hypothetical protein
VTLLVGIAYGTIDSKWGMPSWLPAKLALFASVTASGAGIRMTLIGYGENGGGRSARRYQRPGQHGLVRVVDLQ